MSKVDIARKAWGPDLPDWVLAMAEACDTDSQNAVAARLGRSASAVSTVISNTYQAGLGPMEELVRGVLLSEMADCPQLGPIGRDKCKGWRVAAAKFQRGNPLRLRMYRACHRCPIFLAEKESRNG